MLATGTILSSRGIHMFALRFRKYASLTILYLALKSLFEIENDFTRTMLRFLTFCIYILANFNRHNHSPFRKDTHIQK